MAAEYLSNQLSELLRAQFVDDAKACDSVLDDPDGALCTFSARIEFAYLLGLVGPIARRELHLIRKVRSDFAHEYKPLAFSNEGIASRCRELRAYTLFPDPSPRANFVRTVMGLLAVLHSRIVFATHAVTSEDHLIQISEEERHEIQEAVRRLVEEFVSDAPSKDSQPDVTDDGDPDVS